MSNRVKAGPVKVRGRVGRVSVTWTVAMPKVKDWLWLQDAKPPATQHNEV